MTDIEKVKDGIKHCSIDHTCENCPFKGDGEETCITRLQRMAYNVICDLEEGVKE